MATLNTSSAWHDHFSGLARLGEIIAMKTALLIMCLLWGTVVRAGDVDLIADAKISDGKGWVVFSIEAPDPGELLYSVSYKQIGGRGQYKDTFSYGKSPFFFDRSPNLASKYGLPYDGRLIALELEPGMYLLDTVTIQSTQDLLKVGNQKTPEAVLIMKPGSVKTSDGSLNVKFQVEAGKAKYLGHWNFEVGDTQKRVGTFVGVLLLGYDFGGFSLNFKVSDRYEDVVKIFSEKVPSVHTSLMSSLVKSAAITRNFHPLEKYSETAFATLEDVAAVPLTSVGCRKNYENWLKQKPPRAFAVGVNKGCGFSWGNQPKNPEDSPIPAERVIAACERINGPCVLYAVDDRVVYKKPDQNNLP